jgi:hypothetical protein
MSSHSVRANKAPYHYLFLDFKFPGRFRLLTIAESDVLCIQYVSAIKNFVLSIQHMVVECGLGEYGVVTSRWRRNRLVYSKTVILQILGCCLSYFHPLP